MQNYQTLKVRIDRDIAFIQMYRPENNNTVNQTMIDEFSGVLQSIENDAKIVVIEGLPEVFCFGADFQSIEQDHTAGTGTGEQDQDPGPLYDIWMKLATGPFISIAHVRGKANAGGVGFVAACDIVLADDTTVFSLSELLFGLMPACVLPFLIRRMGFSKAHYMTLLTQPIDVAQAKEWGLVDAVESNSSNLLRKQLLRLRRLNKTAIMRYKRYMNNLDSFLGESKQKALAANIEVFSDQENLDKISRYVSTGKFPWEDD